jgi:hypothetical protein
MEMKRENRKKCKYVIHSLKKPFPWQGIFTKDFYGHIIKDNEAEIE